MTQTFAHTVTDGNGGTDTGTLAVTVTGTNDAPVANDDTNGGDAVLEDSDAIATGNLLANDIDIDTGAVLAVTAAGPLAGVYGSLAPRRQRQLDTYTLNDADPGTNKLAAGQTAPIPSATVSDGIAARTRQSPR